jgi:hypothetical protein
MLRRRGDSVAEAVQFQNSAHLVGLARDHRQIQWQDTLCGGTGLLHACFVLRWGWTQEAKRRLAGLNFSAVRVKS